MPQAEPKKTTNKQETKKKEPSTGYVSARRAVYSTDTMYNKPKQATTQSKPVTKSTEKKVDYADLHRKRQSTLPKKGQEYVNNTADFRRLDEKISKKIIPTKTAVDPVKKDWRLSSWDEHYAALQRGFYII